MLNEWRSMLQLADFILLYIEVVYMLNEWRSMMQLADFILLYMKVVYILNECLYKSYGI